MDYFDPTYFDPTYFDTPTSSGGQSGATGGGRQARQSRMVIMPQPEVVDEDWVVVI